MPIIVPDHLPAIARLKDENISVLTQSQHPKASHRILLLNLMPIKETTETDFIRVLSSTPLFVELQLLRIENHVSKNTSSDHLHTFYKTFREIQSEHFDGFIITGAPIEHVDFNTVRYWSELAEILDWVKAKIPTGLFICWGAQAALYHYHKIPKQLLGKKLFGIFSHNTLDSNIPLLRGFDDQFMVPHSRHSCMSEDAIHHCKELKVLVHSPEAGSHLIASTVGNYFFITGHHEYSRYALDEEYQRDLKLKLPIELPQNYYKHNDPQQGPQCLWKSHAQLLFQNWLTHYVAKE